MTIDTLARRRIALLAQREDIDAEIKNIDAQLIDAVEVGGHVDIDGQPVWRVQQRRTFSVDLSSDYCRLAQWRTNDPGELTKAAERPKPKPVIVPDGQEVLFP